MIDDILTDLDSLIDQAMWAHVHGYWKEGHGLDAEHGTDLSRSEADRQKGPTYDLEIGCHTARVAYQGAVSAVSGSDVLAAAILHRQGLVNQLPVEPLDVYVFPFYLRRTAHRLAWRLGRIDETRDKADLLTIRKNLDKALRGLSKTFEHGTIPSALRENPCRTCGIRDRAPKRTECKTCETWRLRHDGQPRPKKLDADSINQARAAQIRRLARGDGWGAA